MPKGEKNVRGHPKPGLSIYVDL